MDFKKAFDQVPHQRLLSKLSSVGITGNIHKWIADLDSNGYVSAIHTQEQQKCGIPHGSILGPILFTIFMNDLPEWVSSNCTIFADDTKLYNVTATVSNYKMTLMICRNGLKCGICTLMQTNVKLCMLEVVTNDVIIL